MDIKKDDKDGGKKKRSKSKTPGSTPKVKKRKVEKISRSKQLEAKLTKAKPRQRIGLNSQPRSTRRRTCVNGKPMPSLAELERMFATSSEDEENGPAAAPHKSSAPRPSRCNTPDAPIIIGVDQLASPTTLKDISEKVIDFISNLPDTIVLDEDPPSPPPKTRKKPDVAYIERTKDCQQLVGYKSGAVVGAGDNFKRKNRQTEISDDESPGKRHKSQIKDPCTSIFNSHAEEIAAKLRAVEAAETLSNSSSDSNKTIPYDCAGTSYNRIRNFSPLPSTSTDTETFLKNDDRFNESLQADDRFNESLQADETFKQSFAFGKNDSALNDNDTAEAFEINTLVKTEERNDVVIMEVPCETIIVDDDGSNSCSKSAELEIVETKSKEPIVIEDSIGDLYSSIINLDDYNDNDVCEVIDVDDIIAENQAVLRKYKTPAPKTITYVDLNDTSYQNESPSNDNKSKSITETSVVNVDNPLKNDVMENIVKNFFDNQSPSKPVSKSCLDTVYDSLIRCTESIVNAFRVKTSQPHTQTPVFSPVTVRPDLVDLDQFPNNRPVSGLTDNTFDLTAQHEPHSTVPVNAMNNTLPRLSALCAINSSNSVILENNVPDFINPSVYQRTRGRAKKQSKKNKPPIMVTPVPLSPITDERENQPPKRLGDCPICMENLSNQAIASTICGHLFCMPCIQAAIKASGKKCPTCRKTLKGVGYHQIFI